MTARNALLEASVEPRREAFERPKTRPARSRKLADDGDRCYRGPVG